MDELKDKNFLRVASGPASQSRPEVNRCDCRMRTDLIEIVAAAPNFGGLDQPEAVTAGPSW